MLKGMESCKGEENGRKRAWIGLALTNLLLLRVSNLFAEDDGSIHAVYCLRGGDVAFNTSERQVEGGRSPEVDTVGVNVRGS